MRKALRRLLVAGTAALTVLFSAPAAHADGSFTFLANAVSLLDEQLNSNGDPGCYDVVIQSAYLGLYVSAEQNTADYPGNEYGALRARTTYDKIGPWEKFHLCSHTDYLYTLQASNGLLVSADYGLTGTEHGTLRAGWATAIGPWEEFNIVCGGTLCNLWNMGSAANNLVSAESGSNYTGKWTGLLRARSSAIGPWENFG